MSRRPAAYRMTLSAFAVVHSRTMSEQIDFDHELDRNPWRIGDNLPWTAPWSGEGKFRLTPSAVFPGLRELIQLEAPGEGAPQFQGMNLMRQRRGVNAHLCQVCGLATTPSDRWLFPTVTGAFIKVKVGLRYATHMPPTHAEYARRAARLCPHLRAALAEPVAFPRDIGFLAPETSLPTSLAHLEGQLPKGVVFSYFRVFSDGFTRVVRRLREPASPPPTPEVESIETQRSEVRGRGVRVKESS